MSLRTVALGVALAGFTAGAAHAQSTTSTDSPAPSGGGKGDTAATPHQQQDPTLGAGAVQPNTAHAARTHRHRGSTGGGASDRAPGGPGAPPPTLPDSSPSGPTPGPGL